jgi:FlgD Ig-like domain
MSATMQVQDRSHSRGPAPVLAFAVLAACCSSTSRADILPLLNASSVVSASTVQTITGPLTDTKIDIAPPTPDVWNGQAFSNVSDSPNSAFGLMTMSFSANATGFRIFTGGSANVINEGTNKGAANLGLFFQALTVQEADFSITLAQNALPGVAVALLFPFDVRGDVAYRNLAPNWGTTSTTGRIAPGLYFLTATAKYDSTALTGGAPAFELDASFTNVANPLVATQPAPQTTAVGASSNFSVATNSPFASFSATTASTFQWRRNLVNLSDGGRISGATTNHLTITSTAYADSGFYDVIVTQGSIVEPSSLAKLTVVSSTTDAGPPIAFRGVELSLPRPNPAHGRTRVDFTLPAVMPASLEVLDVGGRVVKTLLPRSLYAAGERTAEWDGNDERGAHAAPGIYFMRLSAGTSQIVRRVVNLASAAGTY